MKGLRIIRDDERLKYVGDEYTIFYRRITNSRRGRIMEKHRKRGKDPDLSKATTEMMEFCVTGWKGFYYVNADGARVDLPYDPTLVEAIPDEVLAELVDLCGANADAGQVEAKNSPTTSASSTTTAATPAPAAGETEKTTTPDPSSAT